MRLLIPAIAILIISCSEKDNSTLDFKTSSLQNSLAHVNRHRERSQMMIRAYYSENPVKYREAYRASMCLDSLADGFGTYIDSLLELNHSDIDRTELFDMYNSLLVEVDRIRLRNYIDIETDDTFKIGEKALEVDKELLLYLNQNMNLVVSEAMWYLSADMGFGGGFSIPEIAFKHDRSNRIELRDEIVQKSEYREIKLTEILKDGKPYSMRPRIRNVYTFSEIEFDTLTPGAYSLKGDVHMLFGYGSFKVEPFEYEFEVE